MSHPESNPSQEPSLGDAAGRIASAIPQSKNENSDFSLAETIRAPFQAIASTSQIYKAVTEFFEIAMLAYARAFIAPMEVCCRLRIGERHMGLATFLNSIIILSAMVWLDLLYFQKATVPTLAAILFVGMLIHGALIFWAHRKRSYWHSYSDGISLFRIKFLERLCQRWNFQVDISKTVVEPWGIMVIVGILTALIPWERNRLGEPTEFENLYAVLMYFQTAACVSMAYQWVIHMLQRRKSLDEKDAKVLLDAKKEAEKGPQPKGIRNYRGVVIAAPQPAPAWAR